MDICYCSLKAPLWKNSTRTAFKFKKTKNKNKHIVSCEIGGCTHSQNKVSNVQNPRYIFAPDFHMIFEVSLLVIVIYCTLDVVQQVFLTTSLILIITILWFSIWRKEFSLPKPKTDTRLCFKIYSKYLTIWLHFSINYQLREFCISLA